MAAKVLRQTGKHLEETDILYKAVLKRMLIYGCDSWVVKNRIKNGDV